MLDCSPTGAPSLPAHKPQLPAKPPAPAPDPKTPKPRPDPDSHSKPPATPLQTPATRAPAKAPPAKPAPPQPADATALADPPLSPKPSNPPAKTASDAAAADNTGPSPAAAPATSSPQPPALLLEVFGGPEAPFTSAAQTLKLQTARPLDKHFQQDILDDACFRTASQHAACSSVKALWVAIPPGPWLPPAHTHSPAEALRTVSHPKGRPDLPEQARPKATAVTASSCASCPARPHRARLWRHFLL